MAIQFHCVKMETKTIKTINVSKI